MPAPSPQRILWITTDHMRYDGIAAYGQGVMHTPNLDLLAGQGRNFSRCFAQNPVCMPSRASFMTGLYPQQTGVTNNGHCLPDDFEPSVARLFKAAGYDTCQIGKLHLQPHEESDLEARPLNTYGFDVFYGADSRGAYHDAYWKWLELKYPEHARKFLVPRPTDPRRKDYEGACEPVDAPWQASHPGWIADECIRHLKMRRHRRCFVHLGFHHPHPPLNPTREAFAPYADADIPAPAPAEAEWQDKPAPLAGLLQSRRDWRMEDFIEYRRHFYAMVTEVDLAIGMLLDWLREADLLDGTLIVFSSDHGDMAGDHGITHKGPHFYDEVMHVPLVLYWPDGLGTAGREVPALVEMVDLLPTLLGLCGAHVDDRLMGRNYAGELLDGTDPQGREDVLAFNEPDWAMIRTREWKYIRYESTGGEVLYDLTEHPAEVRNQAKDPVCRDAVAEMRYRLMRRLLQAGRSPRPRVHCW